MLTNRLCSANKSVGNRLFGSGRHTVNRAHSSCCLEDVHSLQGQSRIQTVS